MMNIIESARVENLEKTVSKLQDAINQWRVLYELETNPSLSSDKILELVEWYGLEDWYYSEQDTAASDKAKAILMGLAEVPQLATNDRA